MSHRDGEAMPSRVHDTLASPLPLHAADTIRFVSPAGTPDRESVEASAALSACK